MSPVLCESDAGDGDVRRGVGGPLPFGDISFAVTEVELRGS